MSPPVYPMLNNPFGEESCEYEVEVLREHYQDYYYDRGRFNRESLATDTYASVGQQATSKISCG